MFGNSFCFLFLKTCFGEYKEKKNFLYFWNQKHVWIVEIKKKIYIYIYSFLNKKIENTKICCYWDLNFNTNSLYKTNSLN